MVVIAAVVGNGQASRCDNQDSGSVERGHLVGPSLCAKLQRFLEPFLALLLSRRASRKTD